MPKTKVTLHWCRKPAGWKRCPVAMGRDGKTRPRHARWAMNGFYLPKGTMSCAISIDSRREEFSLGQRRAQLTRPARIGGIGSRPMTPGVHKHIPDIPDLPGIGSISGTRSLRVLRSLYSAAESRGLGPGRHIGDWTQGLRYK